VTLAIIIGAAMGVGTLLFGAWLLRAALNEDNPDEVTIAWRDAHEREQGRRSHD
jgi:hypothetical protein